MAYWERESGRANGQTKSPKGIPWGLWWVGGLVTGERGENEEQSEKETKGEVSDDAK